MQCAGKGAYGKVWIVQKKGFSGKLYAMKYINKQRCSEMDAAQTIISERNILTKISHPYIVNLKFAYQDDENMYMVLDLMMGGDLRFHLNQKVGGFSEKALRIWTAELALALDYLHRQKIIHRYGYFYFFSWVTTIVLHSTRLGLDELSFKV